MELLSGSREPGEVRFMRASAFDFLIEGTDAHAENYGLLPGAGGRYRLANLRHRQPAALLHQLPRADT